MLSGKLRHSIKSAVAGNTVTIGTGYRIAAIQFEGYTGKQIVHPYSYALRQRGRDTFERQQITNKAGKRQTVRRKTSSGFTTVNVKGFTRNINIPARNPLVFRPEDPARIKEQVEIWLAQQANVAGLKVK